MITEKVQELFYDEDFIRYAKEYLESYHDVAGMLNFSDSVNDFEYSISIKPAERIKY